MWSGWRWLKVVSHASSGPLRTNVARGALRCGDPLAQAAHPRRLYPPRRCRDLCLAPARLPRPEARRTGRPGRDGQRGREFYMKDAYSFDADEEGLLKSYNTMAEAYRSSFQRLALTAVQIEADPGAIGGTVNHEFMQPCPSGEDTFVACENGDYAANT